MTPILLSKVNGSSLKLRRGLKVVDLARAEKEGNS